MTEKKNRILFVDDEDKVLSGLRRMLHPNRSEWDMVFADGGEKALRMMEEKPFDLVVSDMRMPGMSGRQFLEAVRIRYPKTARIVLSGQTDSDDVLFGIGPVHQFLQKPCDAEILKSTIRRTCELGGLFTNEQLMEAVAGLESLPSSPAIYQELIGLLNTPDISISVVGQTISRDIALSAKILQLVNSAFFGISRRVGTVEDAVNLLGLVTVKSLVIVMQVFSRVSAAEIAGFSQEALLAHSVEVALVARKIGETQGVAQEVIEDIGIAGLLHDIGKLILAAKMPDQFAATRELSEQEQLPAGEAERRIIGATHGQIGAYLLGLWGFTTAIVDAIAFHDQPSRSRASEFSALTAVHVADAIVKSESSDGPAETLNVDLQHLAEIGCGDRLSSWRDAIALAA